MKHAKQARHAAQTKWGKGFFLMSQEMQTALVAAEFVKILSQQEAEDGSHAARIVDGANHVLNFEDL